ncbi:MAG: HDOD domain-containing protein [Myxococcales bacterium]|nr:MAG: HDOD domain-containing protein [Myxococcales bacterium]
MRELYDFLKEIDTLDAAGERTLNELVERIGEVKQLPLVARKILAVVEDPKSTAGSLERVIQADQALTTKLLKIANSSFYGLLRKVNTLQRSILVVGFKAIKDIAVSTAILNMYRSSEPVSIKFWEAAVGTGIATRLLSLEFESTDTEEAFVGGLLHNVGKTLMLKTNPEATLKIYLETANDPKADLLALEKKTFGFAYTHAGGRLAHLWNLAPTLEAVIRYHQNFKEVSWTETDLVVKTNIALVSLAQRICRKLGIGYDKPLPEFDVIACPEQEFLKINAQRTAEITEEVKLAFFAESQLFA